MESTPAKASGGSVAHKALLAAALTTASVTLLSYTVPEDYSATAVGATFFAATYWLVLRHETATIRRYALGLGGLLEPEPLSLPRLVRSAALAVGWALLAAALFFPPFWLGFVWWWAPRGGFAPYSLGLLLDVLWQEGLGQWLVIALPEEMFYRGYLQHELDRAWPPSTRLRGSRWGLGLVVTSLVFALGHIATEPALGRLAVFFPSLVFGALASVTRGIGAPALFHALCNLFASYLARGYSLGS